MVTEHHIEFRHLEIINFPIANREKSPMDDVHWGERLKKETKFSLQYLLCALLSRGSVVKDQMLFSAKNRDEFVEKIISEYKKDKEVRQRSGQDRMGEDDAIRLPFFVFCSSKIQKKQAVAAPSIASIC